MVAKPAKTKGKLPISRHPLFPMMVAIWFAALFGLGSLAIRPTLLESFVLAMRLDLVIPAAAPPLGFTFRILLALGMFTIGGAIGFILARRIGREREVIVEGRRFGSKYSRPAAPTTVAADIEEEDDESDFARLDSARQAQAASAANAIPGRRRALAMEEDFATDHHELVPLPGGAPQILDLADLGGMTELGGLAADQVEPLHAEQQLATEAPDEPQDAAFAEPAAVEPAFDPWQRHVPLPPVEQVEMPSAEPDAQHHRAFDAPGAPIPDAAPSFAPPPVHQAAPAQTPSFAAPASFSMPEPVTIFADYANDEPLTPFAPVAAPAAQAAPAVNEPAPAPVASLSFAAPAEAEPVLAAGDAGNPAIAAPRSFDAAVADAPAFVPPSQPVAEQPQGPVFGQASGDAVERLVAAPVGSLGVVQLAERLALAIARKRDAAVAQPEAPAVAAPSAPLISPPPLPMPPVFAAPAGQPEPAEPVVAEVAPEAEVEAPVVEAAPAPVETVETVAPAQFCAPSPLPAAFRPLAFDDHEDDEPLEAIVPPRRFAMPANPVAEAPVAPAPATFAAPASFVAPVAEDCAAEPAQTDTDAEADDGYGSLLNLRSPARPFVRIEEPEESVAEVEPVVIFPGQEPRQSFAGPFGGNAAAQPAPEGFASNIARPFDAPSAVPSMPLRMPAPGQAIDPQETERQLKAALATLQRMSGAA